MADELDNFFDELNEDEDNSTVGVGENNTEQNVEFDAFKDESSTDGWGESTDGWIEDESSESAEGWVENDTEQQDGADGWGESTESSWDDVPTSKEEASTSDSDDGWLEESDDNDDVDFNYTENQQSNNNKSKNNEWQADVPLAEDEATEEFKKKFNVNYKQASLIIAGICIVVAFVFFSISKIHITPENANVHQQNIQKEANKINQEQTSTNKELKYIAENVSIQYNSDVLTSSGVVKDKTRYLLGNQLIYDIVIEIPTGTATASMHYYCGKDAYGTVSKGTTVTVEYQVADDNYYSIKCIKTN